MITAIEVSCFEKGKVPSSTNIFILAYLYEHQDREVYQKDLEEVMQVRGATIAKVLKGMEWRKRTWLPGNRQSMITD